MSNILPQSIKDEQVALGLMLSNKETLTRGISSLSSGDFWDKKHKIIFEAIDRLYVEGKFASLRLVVDYLRSKNSLDVAGGEIYLIELIEAGISDTEFDNIVEIIKDKSSKRGAIEVCDNISKMAFKDNLSRTEFIDKSTKMFMDTLPLYDKSIKVISSGDLYRERALELKKRQLQKGMPLGFDNLDDVIVAGWRPTDVSIIAARPSIGKSAFKTNLMIKALERGDCVVNFALEQGFATEQDRMEAIMGKIPLTEIIKSGQWKKGDYRVKIIKEVNRIIDEQFNYHIIPSRNLGTKDVRPILYRIAQKQKPGIVFFDLFDKLKDVNVEDNTPAVIGSKLGEMARIAEEFDTHICLLVQINREVTKKANKRPKMSYLKASGAYEEVARLIMLLYREKFYFPDSLNTEMEIIVDKQSNGPRETATLEFDDDTLQLTDTLQATGDLI